MKNTQQIRPMAYKARQKMLLLLSFICFSQISFGQISPPMIPPAVPDYTFPGTWGTSTVTNSHCYSRPGWWGCPPPAGANVGLLVSCWELGGVIGFGWQTVDWGTFAIYESGTITLPAGATDPNVGIITAGPTGQQIDVSYYLSAGAASGHYVDIYDWNSPAAWGCGSPGGIALNVSNQLSCIPTYTRISMDSHLGYGTAIVWEDPTAGTNEIHVVAAQMNVFGPVQRIAGTAGHLVPEVAFVHYAGPLEIHVASYDPAGGNIEEYYFNWMDIIPGGMFACVPPGVCNACALPLARIVMDVNAVGAATPNSLHIDAPDHYNGQNWAYTWELGNDIFARVFNPNVPPWVAPAMGGVATVCFTNGFYVAPFYPACCPMPVINATSAPAVSNTVPVICWDQFAVPVGGMPVVNQQSFYVAWHTTFNDAAYNPASDAYIGIQVNEDGLVRNPMPMPFNWLGGSLVPANISPTPTFALSECNENVRMYTTFSEFNLGNYMQNRWPLWNSNSLKPGAGNPNTEKLEIKINPNPFKDKLTLDFPHEVEMEFVKVRITDMAGKEYGSYNNIADGANDHLCNVARVLPPGNYNVSVECAKIQFQKVYKVTKLD